MKDHVNQRSISFPYEILSAPNDSAGHTIFKYTVGGKLRCKKEYKNSLTIRLRSFIPLVTAELIIFNVKTDPE